MSFSSPATPRLRVLLADDHPETAGQLRTLLVKHFDVIGLVEDGCALVSAAADLAPDVIVADIDMPGLTGFDAAVLIRRRHPDARIVFVTVHEDALMVERGMSVGALGYVLKETAGRELVPAVRAAQAGERYVSRALSESKG